MEPNAKRYRHGRSNVYRTLIVCSLLGIVFSMSTGMVSVIAGLVATVYICIKLCLSTSEDGYLLLFGTQFLRAVIRIQISGVSLSFLLLAFPVFLLKELSSKQCKINKRILIPIFLMIWDLSVSFYNGTQSVGDQVLWGLSFVVLVGIIWERKLIDLERVIIIFGISIWAICIVNIVAEIRIFGQTLVPSMYGTWNSMDEYYSFGKGYAAIAGGNEIAQYIPLFIAMSVLGWKRFTKYEKQFVLLSSIFFVYIGMMCIARAFYIEMLLFIAIYILHISKRPVRLVGILLVVCLISSFVMNAYIDRLEPILNAVLIRFDEGGSSRMDLIRNTMKIWKSNMINLLCGIGTEYTQQYETAHNQIIDALVSLGLIGAVAYFCTLLGLVFRTAKIRSKKHWEGFAPLIMLFVYKMISGCVKDVPFYFVVGICLLFLREYKESVQYELG